MNMSIWMAFAGLVAGHVLASFTQTSLHRALGHGVFGGRIRAQHVGEHHSIYSGNRLEQPQYSDDEKSLSVFYILPASLLILSVFLAFPGAFAAGFAVGLVLSYLAHIFLHAQYHLSNAFFENRRWFKKLRALHMVHHHHQDRNFAVIDLYWDKLMGTFAGTDGAGGGDAGCP